MILTYELSIPFFYSTSNVELLMRVLIVGVRRVPGFGVSEFL